MTTLHMPKATAVWLIDNTTLTFDQVAEFCGFHPLEIAGIADGDVAVGIKGADPIVTGQLDQSEIERCQNDPTARLKLNQSKVDLPPEKRKGPSYTPISRRQDRPDAINWLLRYHPELTDGQISKLVGTTKTTITAVRDRTHWNTANLQLIDPVSLALCSQTGLDEAVAKAQARKAREDAKNGITPEQAKETLIPVLETTSPDVEKTAEESAEEVNIDDAEALFNLPRTEKSPESKES